VSTTSPAVVTAAALLWQARAGGQREERRQRAEADERRELRKDELQLTRMQQAVDLANHWSERRRNGHIEFLASCAQAIDTLELQIDPYFGNECDLPTAGLPTELIWSMRSELAHIELMSNDLTQAAARQAFGHLDFVAELAVGIYAFKDVEGDVDIDELEVAVRELSTAKDLVDAYRMLARAELGTNA